ncbi:N-acetylmuramidase domain-containing protein [Methylobacterium sp. yr668]|uniref:N-acetylmuramidase domain-containing protein n=1 Tax=Methylobacterium sp. yr668 TaxID=1761801 RepID=UPI00244E90B1|nr:N-acetylmuramidase domain-containing protein [Methylobacterium sp. yr668]
MLLDLDLPRVGYTTGVGEDEIHAVIDVEAAGNGFDKLKRPKMLFEPHRFYANLSGEKRAGRLARTRISGLEAGVPGRQLAAAASGHGHRRVCRPEVGLLGPRSDHG